MGGLQEIEHADEGFGVTVRGESEFAFRRHERVIGVRHREEGAVEDAMRVEHDEAGFRGGWRRHRGIIGGRRTESVLGCEEVAVF